MSDSSPLPKRILDLGAAPAAPAAAPRGVDAVPADDPYALCLAAFLAVADRPVSIAALTAGLPLEDGRVTPTVMLRALERAGYTARLAKRPLSGLKPMYLPAILFLKEREACILTRRDGSMLHIHDPVAGSDVAIAEADLARDYSGHCMFARRSARLPAEDGGGLAEGTGHWFWSAVGRLWRTYLVVALAAAFINLLALASPLFTMNVYDRVLPNKAIPTLWVLAIGMIVALAFDLALRTLRSWLIDAAGRRADVLLASRIYSHVLSIELGKRPLTTGAFAAQVKDFESIREFFTSSTIASFTDMMFFGLFLFVIHQVGGIVVAVPAVAAAAMVGLGLVLQIPLRRVAERHALETAQRHSLLVETIAALETVKAIRGESHLQRIWERLVGMTSRTVEIVRELNAALANLSLLVQQFVVIGVIVVGTYLFEAGEMTTGAIIACVMLASRAVSPLGQFAIVLARAQQSFAALKQLNAIMRMPSERPETRTFITAPIANCSIQFQNVAFAYPSLPNPVIGGINLTIRPGERVGIIGKIGSGKTTVGRLLTKLYEPQEGAILIDNIDIRQYHPHEIRRVVGLMGQDGELFHGSVRSNILLACPGATDAQFLRACRLAGVDDFVRRHPAGYEMQVGERGQALSGGQRQSVALARLLINDPQVIFLDEPSSAMDLASERLLIEQLRQALRPDQTVIVATHRYSMLDLVDRLIVLNNGKIAADGPKEQVLDALRRSAAAQPRA
jgi:ATP-binding cassette subfamily C protein LapB